MTPVALCRCETYEEETTLAAVRRAVDLLGGMDRFVGRGQRVLIKPNLLSARTPDRRVTTDPSIVRAVALLVLEAGGEPFIGDSPALDSFGKVCARTGMEQVARELDLNLVELTRPTPVNLGEGAVFRNLEIAHQALDANVVINVPKLKTHAQMLFTLAVKNLFGTIVAQRKTEWHHMAGVDRDTFASLLLDIYTAVGPGLNILDGVWGMEGHGPANGEARKFNLVAASADAVALDVCVCRLLGVPLRMFPLYRAARARKVGETDPEKIQVKGDNPARFAVRDLQVPQLDSMGILPGKFDWFTRRYLVSKPVHERSRCVGCGQCEEICPAQALELRDKKLTFDYGACIRCYCCQEICPRDAIGFRKGMLVRILNVLNR